MIELHEVTRVFDTARGPVKAVDGVSLQVKSGETLCLIGTSGSGKTTTMKMINRLIEPTSGEILLNGESVRGQDVIRLRRSIGYVIQKGGLLPHLTVADNVGLLCQLEGWKAADTQARVAELLELVALPMEKFGHRYPAELSGGQQQRVGVVRALALDPEYLLMDEPFGALDPITRDQIQDEFIRLSRVMKKTIVLVTHDMAEAFKLGDRIALMDQGRLVQLGTQHQFRSEPANDFVAEFLKSHLEGGGADLPAGTALDELAQVVPVHPGLKVGELLESAGGELPVILVDDNRELRGLIGPEAPADMLLEKALESDVPVLSAEDTVRDGLRQFLESGAALLPVVDEHSQVVGAVTPESLLSSL